MTGDFQTYIRCYFIFLIAILAIKYLGNVCVVTVMYIIITRHLIIRDGNSVSLGGGGGLKFLAILQYMFD